MKKKLLKSKDLLLLISGAGVSAIGTDALAFAMSLYVLEVTGSPTLFASVIALATIPEIILAPIGGALADRYNKKKIIVSLDFISGIILAIYSIYFMIYKSIPMHLIYLLVVLQSIISAIFNPCISTVIPFIVDDEDLVDANVLNSICMRTIGVISPIIASCVYGVYGILFSLIIDSCSFFISSITEMFIKIPKVDIKESEESVYKTFIIDIKEGIQFVVKDKIILTICSIGTLINFAASAIGSIALMYLLKVNLQVEDAKMGVINSIIVGISILTPILCNFIFKKSDLIKIFFRSIVGMTIVFILMTIVSSSPYIGLFDSNVIPVISIIIVICLMSLIAGVASMALGIMMQQKTPRHMLGRVAATFNAILMCAMPCGQMIFGCALDIVPISVCIGGCSVLIALSAVMCYGVIVRNEKNKSDSVDEETASA